MLALDLLASCSVPALALLGWPIVRRWRLRSGSTLSAAPAFAASLALGLLFVQAGGMLLGFLGMLHAWACAAWLCLGAAGTLAVGWRRGRPRLRLPRPSLASIATAAVFVLYLLMATVPPWYRDEMVYHLSLPRAFAMAGGYVQPDDNIYSAFPLGFESIEAVLHAFGSAPDRFAPFNPRLVGAWTALGAALASVGLARAAGASERLAAWAGPLLLLVPTFVEFGASAYVEPYLMLASTLALAGVLRALAGEDAALVPAAIFAGAAASVKYPGLAVCAFLAVVLVANLLRRDPAGTRRAARQFVLFCSVAAPIAAPFYLRNALQRGNPVFPVAFELLGGKGWDSWRSAAYAATLADYGMGRSPIDLLLLPFRLFTATSIRHQFEGSLGPVLGLGAIAGALLAARRSPAAPRRPLAGAALFALLWSVFWISTVQQVRFYLVAVPALIGLTLAALGALEKHRPAASRALLAIAVAGCAAWCAPLGSTLWDRQKTTDWIFGRIDRDALLSRLLPESYPFEREIESLVPPGGKIWLVWMRAYTYYLRRPCREDMVFEAWRLEALLDRSADPQKARDALLEDGISHLLVHHRFFLVDGNADLEPNSSLRTNRLRQRFQALIRDGTLRAIRSWGPVTLYAVSSK